MSGGGKKTQIMGFCLTRKRSHANETKPVSVLLACCDSIVLSADEHLLRLPEVKGISGENVDLNLEKEK